MGLSSRCERCDCPRARVREENVDVTMFLFHDGIEPVQIFQARNVAHDRRNVCLDRGCGLLQLFLSSSCDHDVAPSSTKRLAVAKPIPLLPPVMTATLPSSFFMIFCPSFCVVFVLKFEKHGTVPGSELREAAVNGDLAGGHEAAVRRREKYS